MTTVRWEAEAADELARLWMAGGSVHRRAITLAAHGLDLLVASDPEQQGESRNEGLRVAFILPLGFLFRVEEDGPTVTVIHVWDCSPRNR
jgi:hypothetical protein